MDRLAWAGTIGVIAIALILFSNGSLIQYAAGVALLAGARPFYRAIKDAAEKSFWAQARSIIAASAQQPQEEQPSVQASSSPDMPAAQE